VSILPTGGRPGRRAARLRFRPSPLGSDCDEWLALDQRLDPAHPARRLWTALARLDPLLLWRCYAGFGSPAYQPLPLLAFVLYQIHHGFHSPALWHRHAQQSDPARWMLRGYAPSRSCWYDFRDRLDPAVLALAQQAVAAAVASGFTPADRAALDGTTLAANSTRHKMLNEETLLRRLTQLEQAVRADQPPAPPVAPPPVAPPPVAPAWMAATAGGRRRQLRRYKAAGQQMARRQQRNRGKRASKRTAAERILISPGDPEAVVARDKEKVFRPLYNGQLLADLDSALILAYDVAAQQNDSGLLGGLLGQAKEGLGHAVKAVVADSAYAGGQDLADAAAQGTTVYAPWQSNDPSAKKASQYYPKEQFQWLAQPDAYVCPAGQTLSYRGSSRQRRSGTERIELRMYRADESACHGCDRRGECTPGKGARSISRSEHEDQIEALRERMKGEESRALYRLRKQTVERLNADLKQHRGLRRLSGRGLKRARTQLGLVVLAHNLITLDKLRRKRAEGVATATPSPSTG
jgi:transposase